MKRLLIGAAMLASAASPAVAGTTGALYDIEPLLREPHPFENPPPARPAGSLLGPSEPRFTIPDRALAYPNAPALAPRPQPAPAGYRVPADALAYPNTPVRPRAEPAPRSTTTAAQAPRPTPQPAPARGAGYLSEVRLGAMVHDYGPFSSREEDGADINAEILFASPAFLDVVWAPRPHIGGHYHTEDDTHQVYAGLTWTFELWQGVFFDFSTGGVYHTGQTDDEDPELKALGCPVLFRQAVDLGYRFDEAHALMVHFSHISNANLCDENEGLENVGVRYGYRF